MWRRWRYSRTLWWMLSLDWLTLRTRTHSILMTRANYTEARPCPYQVSLYTVPSRTGMGILTVPWPHPQSHSARISWTIIFIHWLFVVFYLSFVVTPLCSNASELVSSLIFAYKKKKVSSSMTFSQVYPADINNWFNIHSFCGAYIIPYLNIIWTKELYEYFHFIWILHHYLSIFLVSMYSDNHC